MRLIERELGLEIELKENAVSVIVVEEAALRLSMIEGLNAEISGKEGNWLLVENEKNYELAKKMEVILEPFSLELNNRKIKTKLYQDIQTIAQDFFFPQGLEVHSQICNYLEKCIERIYYPVKYRDEWNIQEILKAYGVEMEGEFDNACERLLNYIGLMNEVCGIEIFVTINIKKYLTENQRAELYKLAMYRKIRLVLIEFDTSGDKLDCEELYILDRDGCIITY